MRMISGFAERFYHAGRFPYGTMGGPVSIDQGKQGGTAYFTSHELQGVVCGIFLCTLAPEGRMSAELTGARVRRTRFLQVTTPYETKRCAGMRRYVDRRNKMEAGG